MINGFHRMSMQKPKDECEEKLAVMIEEVKWEIALEKDRLQAVQ